ncbi:MAG: nucleotidyltransferase family protein [Candidatus Latescibacterota bacterium]|nr:MAG: nucleotidyltransferase family protein [Candidatus Latescibacterota bacterium]
MRADEFILLTLAHFARGDEGPPPVIPARVDADFERDLVRYCEWHDLAPLVLASLQKLALGPHLSEFGLQHLKTLARMASNRGDMLLGALDELAVGFRREGVSFLLADDLAAALTVYPVPDLRPLDGIDLLVRDWDWRGIIEACGGAGFARSPRDPAFSSAGEALYYYQHFGPLTMKNAAGIRVRLRFRLYDLGEPEAGETAWGHRSDLAGRGAGLERISLEDLLIRSCMQLAMSRFERILPAVDAGRILTQHGNQLDWEYIESKSRPIYPAFYITCQKIARWLNIPGVSARFFEPGRVRTKLFEVLWRTRRFKRLSRRRPHRHRLRFYVFENGGLRDRLDFLATLVTPRPDWVATFYGRPCKPWLRAMYTYLAFKEDLERPVPRGRKVVHR